MRCFDSLLKLYAVFLDKYFWIFLALTPVFVILCAVLSFVPGVAPDFPDFSEPIKGFEPRGTYVMKRMVTFEETLRAAIESKDLTCQNPLSSKRTKRETGSKREKRSSSLRMCNSYTSVGNGDTLSGSDYLKHYFRGAQTVYESGGNMMNYVSLQAACVLEERLFTEKDLVCDKNPKSGECCPSYSLGNYVAELNKRRSCNDISPKDVTAMDTLLHNCSSVYFSGELDSNCVTTECKYCFPHKDMLKVVFTYLVDKEYVKKSDDLKTTIIYTPLLSYYADYQYYKKVFDHIGTGSAWEEVGVKLVAFDFRDFKFDYFNYMLLRDAVFPVIGLLCIAIILLVYTHSFFIMFLTVFSVISSVVIAYFIYHHIFRLTFFPFLNVITFIFLVGIGADDAFVFSDVWNQAKLAIPRGSRVKWMEYTLRHAAVSMLVTSLTTSAAFYANVVSDITAIRLFGIFAGTSIIINYALMITWFPAGIIALEILNMRGGCCPGTSNRTQESVALENIPPTSKPPETGQATSPQVTDSLQREDSHAQLQSSSSLQKSGLEAESITNTTKCGACRAYHAVRSKCSFFLTAAFEKYIPKSLSLFPLWIFILLAIGIGMLCAIIVSPGLKRPKSGEFQVFSSSHPLEQYNLNYKHKFRAANKENVNFYVNIIFGIKPEDNGNYLEPDNFGHLAYDNSFSITPAENQKWLLNLCSEFRNQSFFDKTVGWSCFPERFKDNCTQTSNTNFPFSPTVLKQCLSDNTESSCSRYSPLLFDNLGNMKVMTIYFPTTVGYTQEYKPVEDLWDDIKAFSNKLFDTAPQGLRNGWSITELRFFALQQNLGTGTISSLGVSLAIAFVVILLTSLNWVISVYGIFTIVCILSTTIGSLVLAGWELNILESIVISVAVGLSVDFTLHYGVAYTLSERQGRAEQVKFALSHIGPAVTLASITTFIAGVFMMFSKVLVYFQMGQFLTLVMAVSWCYGTFFFLSLCYFAGPVGHFGQMNSLKSCSCKVTPEVQTAEGEHL